MLTRPDTEVNTESSDRFFKPARTPGLDNRTLLANHEAQNDTEQRMLEKYPDTLSQMDTLTDIITGQKECEKGAVSAAPFC